MGEIAPNVIIAIEALAIHTRQLLAGNGLYFKYPADGGKQVQKRLNPCPAMSYLYTTVHSPTKH
jgi:hypothetical protein